MRDLGPALDLRAVRWGITFSLLTIPLGFATGPDRAAA
jgi:hypothetical protein